MQNQATHSFHIYFDRPKSAYFVNNSSNPELIRSKYYTVMGTQMGRYPGNFGPFGPRAAKMAQKTLVFVRDTMPPNGHFTLPDLHEI